MALDAESSPELRSLIPGTGLSYSPCLLGNPEVQLYRGEHIKTKVFCFPFRFFIDNIRQIYNSSFYLELLQDKH